MRHARELVGGDAFIAWLPQTLGISRREAAALVHFSRRPKFDASPVRAMTLGEALELVALLCDEYRDWPKTSGVAAKPKAPGQQRNRGRSSVWRTRQFAERAGRQQRRPATLLGLLSNLAVAI